MTKLIKKYKNRRLYDTETSQYITIDDLKRYVLENLAFKVEEVESGKDLTNPTLLQIIVEMESNSTQFLSSNILRQIICLANHPMNQSLKGMMEQMFAVLEKPMGSNPYQQAMDNWNQQMQQLMTQWQKMFK